MLSFARILPIIDQSLGHHIPSDPSTVQRSGPAAASFVRRSFSPALVRIVHAIRVRLFADAKTAWLGALSSFSVGLRANQPEVRSREETQRCFTSNLRALHRTPFDIQSDDMKDLFACVDAIGNGFK